MKDKKCLNCQQRESCDGSQASWTFFIIGLVATVAIRMVTVLMNIHPVYGKISWYIGVAGFLLFFLYKFNVNRSLAKIIQEDNLIEKLRSPESLSDKECDIIAGILCSLKSEKERINYFFKNRSNRGR